jgi:hypothetical protein
MLHVRVILSQKSLRVTFSALDYTARCQAMAQLKSGRSGARELEVEETNNGNIHQPVHQEKIHSYIDLYRPDSTGSTKVSYPFCST